jgi:hypothetical protein
MRETTAHGLLLLFQGETDLTVLFCNGAPPLTTCCSCSVQLQVNSRSSSSGGIDPRFLKDVEEALPCHMAAARHHTQLAYLLCPTTPIAAALSGTSVHLLLGPPRLARLAADALHNKLGEALEACKGQAQGLAHESGRQVAAETEEQETEGSGLCSAPSSASSSCCCPVCLDSLGAGAVVLQPCGHEMCHSCCSSLWGLEEQEMLLCPLCRAAVGDICRPST